MTTNVRRASETDESLGQAVARRILLELKSQQDRDERLAAREAQRSHARKWFQWDAANRDLRSRCGFCGQTSMRDTSLRVIAADFAGVGAHGHLAIGFCSICGNLFRQYDATRNQPAMVLWKSIKRAGLADYYPAKDHPDNERARVGLSWAGWTFRARVAGDEDPGDETVAYSHLQGIEPDVLDYSPSQPIPAMPRRLPAA